VPALLSWHPEHRECLRLADGAAVPAHAVFETYSVLTRLPGGQRTSGPVAQTVLDHWLSRAQVLSLPGGEEASALRAITTAGIEGGATYDGLIGWIAGRHGMRLVSRDQRASRTYARLGIDHELM
jgi:hypothetical protein